MPKKRNSSGQLQNYVPAGNGDASGEYGDNASGSNIHYVAKGGEKPSKTEGGKTDTPKDQDIAISIGDNKGVNNFKNYISETFKGDDVEFGKNLDYHFESGNDFGKSAVNYAIGKGAKVNISVIGCSYCDGAGSVAFTKRSITTEENEYSSKARGETFYHEFWHSIDHLAAKEFISEEDKQHATDNTKGEGYLKQYYVREKLANVSTGKKLSNGKTLYETLKDECHKITLNKRKQKGTTWDSIKQDFNDEKEKRLNEKYPELAEKKKLLADLDSKLWDKAEEMSKENGNINQSKRQIYYGQLISSDTEYSTLYLEVEKMKRYGRKIEADLQKSWMSVSDMYGMYNKVGYGFCGGHEASYTKTRGKEIMANEFIAELGSAFSRDDEFAKEEQELLNKYFPETSKMCKELFDMIAKKVK